MASHRTALLDTKLAEQLSNLSPAQKRETLDFVSFIATQRRLKPKNTVSSRRIRPKQSIEAIFDLATDCKDTDLSVNHDKYLYGADHP